MHGTAVRMPLLLATAVLASACATAPPPRHVALDAGCVGGIDALHANPMPNPVAVGKTLPPFIDFADVGECVQDGSAPIAMALFALPPDVTLPARLELTAPATAAATLAASVSLLDANREVIVRHGFQAWSRRSNTFTLDLFLADGARRPAYVLLVPDSAWVGTSDESTRRGSSTAVVPVGVGAFAFTSGFELKAQRALSDAGSIRLQIVPSSGTGSAIGTVPAGRAD